MSATQGAVILAWLVILLLSLTMAGLLRQLRMLEAALRRHGAMQSHPVDGGVVSAVAPAMLQQIFELGHRQAALLFVDPSCSSCLAVLSLAPALAERHRDVRVVVLPTVGEVDYISDNAMLVLTPAESASLMRSFPVPATPFGVLLGSDGVKIRHRALGSQDDLDALLAAGALHEGADKHAVHS